MSDGMDNWEQIGCIATALLSAACAYVFLLTLYELVRLVW